MAEYYSGANRNLGTYHMADNDSYQPLHPNNFEIQIVGLTNLDGYGYADAEVAIRLSVASFTAPNMTVSEIVIPHGNNKTKYAGVPEYATSNMVCNDYVGLDTERVLMAWFKKVYDPTTQKIGYKTEYAKTAYVIQFDVQGNYIRSWRLDRCWPSNLSIGDFTQEGGSVKQVTMTLTYDTAIPE